MLKGRCFHRPDSTVSRAKPDYRMRVGRASADSLPVKGNDSQQQQRRDAVVRGGQCERQGAHHHDRPQDELTHEHRAHALPRRSARPASDRGGSPQRSRTQASARRARPRAGARNGSRPAPGDRARRLRSRCRGRATGRRRLSRPCPATANSDKSGNRGRRARRNCCWSSRRARSAARARRAPRRRRARRPGQHSLRVRSVWRGIAEHASHASSDSVARPPSRCSTTISGFSSSVTVHMPSRPCKITSATSAIGRTTGCCGSRRLAIASPASARISSPSVGGEVSVHHLLDGLVILERPVRERFVDHIDVASGIIDAEMAVAAGPIRAAETGIAQAHPRAEHDDGEGEHDARQREAPEQAVTRGHGSLCA